MADYLLLFRGGEGPDTMQSPEKWQAYMQQWMQWMDALNKQGKLGGAQPLKPAGKTIQHKGKTITDGPFMEGKEMVGGYLICKAGSYEEAVALSKNCPILDFETGIVEIREILEMPM